jgi:hypothetical protein
MAFLSYNGKFLIRSGKWLGYTGTGPVPVPISGDGMIRFQFGNTSISEVELYGLSGNKGAWTPVRDEMTGDAIPGLWDFNYNNVGGATLEDVFNHRLSVQNLPDGVELVDIKDSYRRDAGFWDDAFFQDTALTKATITQLNTSNISSMVHLFQDCINLTEAHVEVNSASTNIEVMFSGCAHLTKIYLKVPLGVGPSMYQGCSSLQELTVELTGNTTGWYLRDMSGTDFSSCRGSLTEVTFIHPYGVPASLTFASQDQYSLFESCTALKHVNHFARVNQYDLEAESLPVNGNTYWMFKGCSSLMAIPSLSVRGIESCSEMFYGCRQVMSGISAAYDALSAASPRLHRNTFTDCGVDTQQGYAELQAVPVSWGGLATG